MTNAAADEGGFLFRILDAIFESHEREADREIAPFVAESGEAFTDCIEREIMQRASIANSPPLAGEAQHRALARYARTTS